jgi:hypothetical protein
MRCLLRADVAIRRGALHAGTKAPRPGSCERTISKEGLVSQYDTPIPARTSLATTGPLYGSRDVVALIVLVIMNLGPLAMAAFWAPYH